MENEMMTTNVHTVKHRKSYSKNYMQNNSNNNITINSNVKVLIDENYASISSQWLMVNSIFFSAINTDVYIVAGMKVCTF